MKTLTEIRWNLETAAREFGLNQATLRKRINLLGIVAADDGMFSTAQIHMAVCEYDQDMRRKARADADTAEDEREARRRNLVSVNELSPIINRAISAIKARIDSASNLEREDKDKIMLDLGKLWDGAFGVAPADKADVEPATAS